MRICALDLGTRMGCATGVTGDAATVIEQVTTWTLANASCLRAAKALRLDRKQDIRVPALWDNLAALHARTPIDWLVFEDVQFSSSTQQTQLWSSFRGVLWVFAAQNRINIECLATGKLKKFATGSGSADKSFMASALIQQHPQLFSLDEKRRVQYVGNSPAKFVDDNAVDAVHLLLWAMKTFRKTN